MLKFRNIVFLLLISVGFSISAQQKNVLLVPDSIKTQINSTVVLQSDSVEIVGTEKMPVVMPPDSIANLVQQGVTTIEAKPFKPSPRKAIIFSAIIPGLGQIYNRKYWKLPILYGGFVGFAYAITWNNGHYQDYFGAYRDIIDGNPDTKRWVQLLPYGQTEASADQTWFAGVLKSRKDFFLYNRDLSIILTVMWYGLGIVDAYVDAQLFDFDITPDLSMRVEPAIFQKNSIDYLANSYGFRCSFNF